MNFQQLKYVIEVANYQSFSKAAKNLYISQSTLSMAIKDLEKKLGIILFNRTKRGVTLTYDGEDFIRYAHEILEQTEFLEKRYQRRNTPPMPLSISSQHLPFAVRAFINLLDTLDLNTYDIAIRECNTDAVIHDVASDRSELGVLAVSSTHLRSINQMLVSYDIQFTEMTTLQNYVFVNSEHPLANKKSVTLQELEPYPFVTYDQEVQTSNLTEEPLFYQLLSKNIHVCDRSTKIALVRMTNSFSIGCDLTNSNADNFHKNLGVIRSIPLDEELTMLHIGYIVKKQRLINPIIQKYLAFLQTDIQKIAK